jgi:glycerophosphoryl diester phosphodiesterase
MTEPLLSFKPRLLAHRGASASAPENTLAAFKLAKEQGAQWLEFDVMLAACGEVVVFHDETLDRTTNGHGPLHEQPYSYLKTLDAGSWFHPRFAGERIPRLREVLEFLEAEQLSANIEIKALPGMEKETVTKVLAQLAQYKKIPAPLFSSFSIRALKELRLQAPGSQLGYLMDEWQTHWEAGYQELHCFSLNLNQSLLNPTVVDRLKATGTPLLAYTVNEPQRAVELLSWGVDAIFTDCPDKILAAML